MPIFTHLKNEALSPVCLEMSCFFCFFLHNHHFEEEQQTLTLLNGDLKPLLCLWQFTSMSTAETGQYEVKSMMRYERIQGLERLKCREGEGERK